VISALWKATTSLLVERGADSLSRLDVKELVTTGVAKINFGRSSGWLCMRPR
jgi:hypothetical protein